MKINLIIPSFYPATIYGGPIFSTLHTCEELAKIEDVEIYVSTTNANMITRLDVETDKNIKFEENFFVKYYNETIINKISLSAFINIWKDIDKSDVVHVQSIFGTLTAISLVYAKLFKKPVVLSPRGSLGGWCIDNGSKFKQMWLNYLLKPLVKNIAWHATAQQEKDEILSIFLDAEVSIIPNGIEYDKFQKFNIMSNKEYLKKYTKQELSAEKIIISMGRLQKKKGFDILIDSFSKVIQTQPKSMLLIAGDDEGELEALEKRVPKLNLENKVFFIGAISGQDKIDFLANADLFVLPSHNENFGNVYIESLATGTPIVASKNTPWEEVEENDCGKWVNNTVEETSRAILTMLSKNQDEMQVNAKMLAKKYDWKTIAKEFKKLYENILENK
jgi:glycosyltransferase involved in cell wall biosynthesis